MSEPIPPIPLVTGSERLASRAGREGDSQPLPTPSECPIAHHLVQDDFEDFRTMDIPETFIEVYEALLGGAMLLKEEINSPTIPVYQAINGDLEQRLQLGISRYGHPLRAFNGRNNLLDAYEEVLDALVYLRTAIYELENPEQRDAVLVPLVNPAEPDEIETLKHMAETGDSKPVRRAEP